jgi:peroxiredoxin
MNLNFRWLTLNVPAVGEPASQISDRRSKVRLKLQPPFEGVLDMKARNKFFSILGLSLALVGAVATAQTGKSKEGREMKGAKIGEAAPAWTLKDINGKEWKSTDFANKIVVLEWVNPGCPVCKGAHEDGRIPNMIKDFKGQSDVVFLGINSTHNTTAEQNKKALEAYKVEYPVLLDIDGTVGKAFGARTTPHVFVIDTTGVLGYSGALDNNKAGDKTGDQVTNYALGAVKQIKAGETVTPDTTQPYGCSVKYANENKAGGMDKEKKTR